MYSQKDNLETGVKKDQGWKAFNEDTGIWDHLKGADQVQTHGSIFIEVDKTDDEGVAAIMDAIRATSASKRYNEPFEAVEDATRSALEDLKTQDFRGKADRQISRCEFMVALVKTAAERFYKSKKNPKNEMDDISDALERLFTDFIEPSLFQPLPGKAQPRLPLPDAFRRAVCYREDVSLVLKRLAPSLRVLFAGLAKISFEKSRGSASPTLPKIKANKKVERERTVLKGVAAEVEQGRWVIVQGHISFVEWRAFCTSLELRGLSLREIALSFVYSRMCAVETTSNDGFVKEYTLPFEGFLEGLCRLAAAVPLPTEAQLTESEFTHAGPFMASMEGDDEAFDAMAEEQACEFGSVPDPATCGPMTQRIEYLNDVIMRKIRASNGPAIEPAEDDEPLTKLTRPDLRGWAVKVLGASEKEIPLTWAKEAGEGE